MKQPGAAIEIYHDILRKLEAGEGKYADLEKASVFNRLGVAFREKGDLEESAAWFGKALAEPRASARSVTVGKLELAKTLDLLGRREQARQYYLAVAAAEDLAGSQGEAQDLLKRPYRR
jgi:tetratricopeptide (TPR) repeat protein